MTEQKTKEIGIRKVMGASIYNITKMLSFHFLRLVSMVIIPGLLAGYLIMNKWLSNFAFFA